ncbi:MAG: hypothetical protein KJ645_03565, partial [Planctomycetes bacterium]|nr:hypothetical protein [Planctomycetota bacterium]
MMKIRQERQLQIFLLAVLAVLIFLEYRGFLDGAFSGNDRVRLYPLMAESFDQNAVESNLLDRDEAHFQPLAHQILALQACAFGAERWDYLLLNAGLHLINILLLYRLAVPIMGAIAAGTGTALFAVHPLIPWIFLETTLGSQAGFLLCFLLLSLWCFLGVRNGGKAWRIPLGLVFLGLSLCTGLITPIAVEKAPCFLLAALFGLESGASQAAGSQGFASLPTIYLLLPFCLAALAGLLRLCFLKLVPGNPGKTLALLVFAGLFFVYGKRTHESIPVFLQESHDLREMRLSLEGCLEAEDPSDMPIYLLDAPRPE